MRRSSQLACDFASRHNSKRWYSSADQLLSDPDINAVYIATPPVYHKDYAVDALNRGLHVYIEKPIAMNSTESIQIAQALKESNGLLSVAHYRRELPLFKDVKSMLDDGLIGDIRMAQIRCWQTPASTHHSWRYDPNISGGGLFHDLSPHQIDIMIYFFGVPLNFQGFSSTQTSGSCADIVCGNICFEHNIIFNGSWCFTVAEGSAVDECLIIGSAGSIKFNFFGARGKVIVEKLGSASVTHEYDHPTAIQQPMIEKVTQYFISKGEETNPCSVHDAIKVMEVMDSFTSRSG